MVNKEFSNREITILWSPEQCIHPGICVKTLPNVYNPQEKPWIRLESASAEQLIDQVAKCPSGALSIKQDHRMPIRFEREDNGKKGRFIIYTIKKGVSRFRTICNPLRSGCKNQKDLSAQCR